MSGFDPYTWLKAAHVAAALVFVGGVLAAAALNAALAAADRGSEGARRIAGAAYGWGLRVTTPAMLAVWGLGLGLATEAGWFAAGWLQVKLACVLALSAVHGMQSGALRRAAAGRLTGGRRSAGLVVVVLAVAIAVLAVAKPF